MRILAFVFLLFTNSFLFAQLEQMKDSISIIKGQKYFFHKVAKGQTLYGLSKIYNVSFSDLKKHNPDKVISLALGDYVKVPLENGINHSNNGVMRELRQDLRDGKKYIHIVDSGETVYGLTNKYNMSKAELFNMNASVKKEGLKIGDTLTVKYYIEKGKSIKPVVRDSAYNKEYFHKVQKGETVYGLSKKFNLSQEEFLEINESIADEGLKVGTLVQIKKFSRNLQPIPKDGEIPYNDTSKFVIQSQPKNENEDSLLVVCTFGTEDKTLDTAHLRIALLLPFNIKMNQKLNDSEEQKELKLTRDAKISSDLFTGLKLALDSLKKEGLRAKIYTFDTAGDTALIKAFFNRDDIDSIDVIMGPIYTSNFIYAAKLARAKNIPIINPFGKNDAVVEGLDNSFRMRSVFENSLDKMAEYIGKSKFEDNIIIAFETEDLELAKKIKLEVLKNLPQNDSIIKPEIHLAEGVYQPVNYLEKNENNILLMINEKEGYCTKLAAKLYSKRSAYDMTLFGVEDIVDFKNIEISYWDSLNIHVAGNLPFNFVPSNFSNSIKDYFHANYSDFNMYSMIGFDMGLVLLNHAKMSSSFNPNDFIFNYYEGLFSDYFFEQDNVSDGFVNSAANIYKYQNYQLIKLD